VTPLSNPVHTFPPTFPKIRFNIIFPPVARYTGMLATE